MTRRRCGTSAALLALVLPLSALHTSVAAPPDAPVSAAEVRRDQSVAFRAALAAIAPSIVRIDTIGGAQPVAAADGPGGEVAAAGFRQADGPTTGLIWSADGYIITSSINFIRDPSIITVALADGRRLVARLVARDKPARLALLKIDATGLSTPRLAPPEAIAPGRWALVAGYGYGTTTPALSVGVISAARRGSGLTLQVDAKTSPANYGGPLFDIDGRLLGVCVPSAGRPDDDEIAGVEWYDSGIGFGVRAEIVAARVERLRAGRDLLRGVMGVNLEQADPVVGDNAEPGIAIRGILQPGPAEAAGLREGDRITGLDGVETPRLIDLRRALATRVRGDEVEVAYLRDGKSATVRIALVDPAETGPPREPATQPGASQPATSQPTASQPGA